MKKIYLSLILIIYGATGFCQGGTTVPDTGFDGSFQVLCSSRTKEIFTTDLLPLVDSLRSDTEVVMYEYSPLSTLRIFPRNMVNSPTWLPVTDIYIFPSKEEILRYNKKQ